MKNKEKCQKMFFVPDPDQTFSFFVMFFFQMFDVSDLTEFSFPYRCAFFFYSQHCKTSSKHYERPTDLPCKFYSLNIHEPSRLEKDCIYKQRTLFGFCHGFKNTPALMDDGNPDYHTENYDEEKNSNHFFLFSSIVRYREIAQAR